LALAMTVTVALSDGAFPPAGGPDFASLRVAWAADVRAKRLDDALAFYTADAVFVLPSGQRVVGNGAMRSLFAGGMKNFTATMTFESLNSDRSGDLAYDSGRYAETTVAVATGKLHRFHGTYLTLYRRAPGGAWLIAEQVWTESEG
jgi:ketosteroid isomerase-like protein